MYRKMVLSIALVMGTASFLFSENLEVGSVIETEDNLGCSSFRDLQLAIKGMALAQKKGRYAGAFLKGWMSNLDCKTVTAGMKVPVVIIRNFKQPYLGYSKGVVVKLPNQMTIWIAK